MNNIQVPDEDQVAVQVDMHEAQIHIKWPDHDIAIPLNVLRELTDATTYLVEQVGGPLTPQQKRELQNS